MEIGLNRVVEKIEESTALFGAGCDRGPHRGDESVFRAVGGEPCGSPFREPEEGSPGGTIGQPMSLADEASRETNHVAVASVISEGSLADGHSEGRSPRPDQENPPGEETS